MAAPVSDPLNPLQILGLAAAAAVGALAAAAVLHVVTRRMGRRSPLLAELARHAHRPVQVSLMALAVHEVVKAAAGPGRWRAPVLHAIAVLLIGAVAWLVAALSFVVEDAAVAQFRVDVKDNRHARRIRTQAMVLRRVTVMVIALIAIGAMLMTFPVARAAGTSLLASAGLLGAIAGFAAQATLGNLFAGVQLAFSDALRLDDVVVVEAEWGRVEDITLTTVIVRLWDDRRMVFPTSYFTSTPFQNWTRTEAAILGTVELDVDWSVPVDEVRAQLRHILEGTQLWDGRVSVLQVTDALWGYVRLRALVSAADAPTSWDLRCLVRERLVSWLRDNAPEALPRFRGEIDETIEGPRLPVVAGPGPTPRDPGARDGRARDGGTRDGRARDGSAADDAEPDARAFGGSAEGERRAVELAGPPPAPDRAPAPAPDRTGPTPGPGTGPGTGT